VIVYLVNYDKPLQNVKIKLNLEGYIPKIDKKKLKLYSPDPVSTEIRDVNIDGRQLELTIPHLEVYQVLTIN
jgi:hypothetical protein